LQLSGLNFAIQDVAVVTFLFALLILAVLGLFPAWPYSRSWGYYPTGVVALLIIVLIVLAVSGRL
jgi:hypothetical protein